MKALTIWQPWASLIAHGLKAYETRAWSPPADLIGQRLAIHAGKTTRGLDVYAASCALQDPACPRMQALRQLSTAHGSLDDLPHGAIIATARLAFALLTDGDLGAAVLPAEQALGDWRPGRWAWRLVDQVVLPRPILCSGQQGLWLVDPNLERRIALDSDSHYRSLVIDEPLRCDHCSRALSHGDLAYIPTCDDPPWLCPACALVSLARREQLIAEGIQAEQRGVCSQGTCQAEAGGEPCGTCLESTP
jgi:hypothetical protein